MSTQTAKVMPSHASTATLNGTGPAAGTSRAIPTLTATLAVRVSTPS